MKENRETLRQSIIVIILACYLAPVLLFTILTVDAVDFNSRWLIFSSSLLLAISGTIFLTLAVFKWESLILSGTQNTAPVEESEYLPVQQDRVKEDYSPREENLLREVQDIKQKWYVKKKEYDHLEKQMGKMQKENQALVQHSQEQLKKKDRLLAEYAQTVNDLRSTMENKQQQIEKLQDSINDLSYDLDTLLNLSEYNTVEEAEKKEAPPTKPPSALSAPKCVDALNASNQLKKCINMAQKFTTSQFTTASRFRDVSIDNTALDQRRLFDSFRSETSCIVIMYSLKEGNMIFANDMTKSLLGFEPDKFVHDYLSLLVQGESEWKEALSSLSRHSEKSLHLVIRSKWDEDILLECRLGVIPTGIFKNHAVGILYEI